MDAPMDMDAPTIESIDGEMFATDRARKISRRLFYFGFCFLPLLWFVNVWLFWHEFKSRPGADVHIKKFTRFSAIAFAIVTALFLPWFLTYVIAGSWVLNKEVYDAIDVTRFNIAALGIPSSTSATG